MAVGGEGKRRLDEDAIVEVKESLAGARQEFRCRLLELGEREAVLFYRNPREVRLHGLLLPAGTMTLGYFWTDRPYNAYHLMAPDGRTLGVYFNLSEATRLSRDRLEWRDLSVDLLVTPDGRARWLDEEELPAGLEAKVKRRIAAARQDLEAVREPLIADITERSARWLARLGIRGAGEKT